MHTAQTTAANDISVQKQDDTITMIIYRVMPHLLYGFSNITD